MSRVPTPAPESATGATAEIYAQIKKAIGKVPNMKKLIFATIAVTLLSSGPVLAESILGDPAGGITRHEWGMDAAHGYASDPTVPEPLAQVPPTPHVEHPASVAKVPSTAGKATAGASNNGGAAQ